MLKVRFMSLDGKFCRVKEESFTSQSEALKAVSEYASAAGFTGVKVVEDNDFDSIRFTARTPGGRSGRNVAFGDFEYDANDY